MAAASDSTSSALVDLEEDLTCSICFNLLREPKDLDCQHIYCLQCLENWVRKQSKINCPECRQVTLVPQDGLTSLKTNLRLKNMVQKYEAQMKEKHQSVPICQIHEGQRLYFFCVTCGVTICHNCLVRKHPLPQHEIEELKDIIKTRKEEMTAKLDRVNAELQKVDTEEKYLDKIEAKIRSAQIIAERSIDKRAKEIITKVEIKREEMKDRIRKSNEENLKMIQSGKNSAADRGRRLQNVHCASQNAVDNASDHVYMEQHASLVEKMEKLCDAQHELPNLNMSYFRFNKRSDPVNLALFGKIVENDHEARKITLVNEWSLFEQVQTAGSVGVTQSGLLAIVDYESSEVPVYHDDNGEYKRQFSLGDSSDDPNGKVARPLSVAVTSKDRFLVIDSGQVKIFSATGQYEQTLPISGAKITTTPDDMIVVGNKREGDIRVYQSSGELLKTHAISSRHITDITSNGKQIAYTTGREGKVCVLDFESGQTMWTFDMVFPLGICYAPISNSLLVAGDSLVRGNCSITQFCSITGCLIWRLTSGLFNPYVMTIRDKKLVIADKTTVRVYKTQ